MIQYAVGALCILKFSLKRWLYTCFARKASVFWIVTLVSFLVYFLTCARHLSWLHEGADGGDLALCAYTLGIPHPTGYPIYCIAGWLFTHLLPFGEVAFRLNIFSAIFAALGAGFIALALKHASDFLFPNAERNIRHIWIPIIGGFSIAFSFSYWTQALIVEVYSMNAFFLAMVTWKITLMIAAENQHERDRHFIHTALIAGLGFTNHLAAIYPLVAGLLTLAYLRYLPSWRTFSKGLLYFILPLLLYLYLPIRSSMNPLMDWGNPETLDGVLWVLSGEQFYALVFSSLFLQILFRIFTQINMIKQFGIAGLIAAFIGMAYIMSIRGSRRLAFFIYLTLVLVLNFFHIANYLVIDPLSFMLPAFMMVSVFAAIGCGFVLAYAHKIAKTAGMKSPKGRLAIRCAKAIVVLVPVLMFSLNYCKADISGESEGYDYAKRAFDNAIPGSVICETFYGRGLTLLYYHHVEGMGKEKNITPIYIEQNQFVWGKVNFRQRHPNLEISDNDYIHDNNIIAYDLIERNYDKVPAIYFGRMFTPPDGYRWEAADDLFRIVRCEDP